MWVKPSQASWIFQQLFAEPRRDASFNNVNAGGFERGVITSMARLAQSVNHANRQRFAMKIAMQAAMVEAFGTEANNGQAG